MVNKNPVSYGNLCDSSSTYSDWYSWDTDYNTKAWREYTDWCGRQSWTRTCKHNVSWNETRCYQRKKVAYFGISFTPESHNVNANWVLGVLSMGPENFKRTEVNRFNVKLKITSKYWRESYLDLWVTPVNADLNSQERKAYTLRVQWTTPWYGEDEHARVTSDYFVPGADNSVKKIELVAIYPKWFGTNLLWQYIYDELAYSSDKYGSKYCGGNPEGWVVYRNY